jgi:hypothetical protein
MRGCPLSGDGKAMDDVPRGGDAKGVLARDLCGPGLVAERDGAGLPPRRDYRRPRSTKTETDGRSRIRRDKAVAPLYLTVSNLPPRENRPRESWSPGRTSAGRRLVRSKAAR